MTKTVERSKCIINKILNSLDWVANHCSHATRFEQLPAEKKERYGYEERFIKFLENMVNDADRKIRKAEEQAEIQNAVVSVHERISFLLSLLFANLKNAVLRSNFTTFERLGGF